MIHKEFSHKISIKYLIFIILLVSFFTLSIIFPFSQKVESDKDNFQLKTSQVANYTIEVTFPKIIWLEAQVDIKIRSNVSGEVGIELRENHAFSYFSEINETKSITGNNKTDRYLIKIYPKIQTFPGVYDFTLSIDGLIEYSQTYESILGLGYLLMFILIPILGVPLIIIMFEKKKMTGTTYETTYVAPSEPVSYESTEGLPAGKIKCPECGAQIPEGLVFCPECGERIPEFLRYNPSS